MEIIISLCIIDSKTLKATAPPKNICTFFYDDKAIEKIYSVFFMIHCLKQLFQTHLLVFILQL